jgi:hypothetical protein
LLASLAFENDPQLKRIERNAFADCAFTSVVLPKSVEVLSQRCFYSCASLAVVFFEAGSQLKRIESIAFADTALESILLPGDVAFIAGNAFPVTCEIDLIEPSPEFAEWNLNRREVDFERKQR